MICVPKKETGFTLMEVLVVVSIVAILSTIGILNYKSIIDNSKRGATLDEVKEYGLQEGIARGDTGVFWRLQDLQSATMPNIDVYGRLINSGSGSYAIDTALWKGPYLNLEKTAGTNNQSKFDKDGYPIDFWGDRYQIALLSTQGGNTTILDNPSISPAGLNPDLALVISWGPDRYPGVATDGIPYDVKSTSFWLYYNEQGSDDIYYSF
jgi:prepilin-type N-terminal cleavage/methylation domain-containing protein